jgi:2'-5' RNA ligase
VSGGGLRLFVAAEPPRTVRDELAMWARRALGRSAQARRLPSDSLHLTLCFLGEQPPAAIEEIAAILVGVTELLAAVEELHLGAPAWLPPRRPRALAVEIGDPSGALRALRDALIRELSATLAWHPARERFRPHITVARMRVGSAQVHELPPTPQVTFAPTAATLFRSTLDPAGASYTPLASIPI